MAISFLGGLGNWSSSSLTSVFCFKVCEKTNDISNQFPPQIINFINFMDIEKCHQNHVVKYLARSNLNYY